MAIRLDGARPSLPQAGDTHHERGRRHRTANDLCHPAFYACTFSKIGSCSYDLELEDRACVFSSHLLKAVNRVVHVQVRTRNFISCAADVTVSGIKYHVTTA